MPYCINCGTSLNNEIKFCPNCGVKIEANITEKAGKPVKKKMQKGVVKSLQKETSNYVKSKIKETVLQKTPKENLATNNNIKNIETEDKNVIKQKKTSKNLILFYVLLNVLLFSFGLSSDDIMGVKFFSVLILIIYFIRHKKEKPFNWLLKIILGLQAILLLSIFMTQSEYLFANFLSFLTTLSLLGLFIVILLLLFKGNKTQ
jgi:uncharacterized Zn finger protein (UPF0148 family)